MEQTAHSELDFEVNGNSSGLQEVDGLSAPLVIAVTLHVHHSLEPVVHQADVDEDAVSQTVDLQVWSVESDWRRRFCGYRN